MSEVARRIVLEMSARSTVAPPIRVLLYLLSPTYYIYFVFFFFCHGDARRVYEQNATLVIVASRSARLDASLLEQGKAPDLRGDPVPLGVLE